MKEEYQNIKKELLNCNIVLEAHVNSGKGIITIKPVQNIEFVQPSDIMQELPGYKMYLNREWLEIGGKVFEFAGWEFYNTQVFSFTLKEV